MINLKTISLDTVLTDGTNQYVVEEFLGDGGFANVFRATSEGESYAIKVLINDNPKVTIHSPTSSARQTMKAEHQKLQHLLWQR